jgi:hypothetical protein
MHYPEPQSSFRKLLSWMSTEEYRLHENTDMRHFFLVLAVAGAIGPYTALTPWLLENGPDLYLLLDQLFETYVSTAFSIDLIISALTFIVFVWAECRERIVKGAWVAVAGTFFVGLSFGLPLYLWLRSKPTQN